MDDGDCIALANTKTGHWAREVRDPEDRFGKALPVTGHSPTVLPDGKVIFVGGRHPYWACCKEIGPNPDPFRYTRRARLHDPALPAESRFVETFQMTEPRFEHGVALLSDGRVLSSGGRGYLSSQGHSCLNSAEIWSRATLVASRPRTVRQSCWRCSRDGSGVRNLPVQADGVGRPMSDSGLADQR